MIKKGLGRGLDSLFGNFEETKLNEGTEFNVVKMATLNENVNKELVFQIDIDKIDPNIDQPRKYFEPEALKELADSIKIHGIIQPIILIKKDNRFMIIAGERRFRAAKMVGLKAVPAIVKQYTDKEINEISIIENLQREDLNPMDQARAIKKLMEDYGWTQEIVADRLGKSRPVIANTIRLLNLEPEVIKMIEENKISAGHARSLVGIANKQAQIKLAKQVAERKLTVRDLEIAVKNSSGKNKIATLNQNIELKELILEMQRIFGTKVSALGSNERGRIYIDYFNKDDLERIYEKIEQLKKVDKKQQWALN